MSRKYKFHDQQKPYFVTFATVNWVDVFTREEYRQVLLNSLQFCQKNKGLEIYAWCLMTNHLHLIIGTDKEPMGNILRDFKSFTSRELKKAILNNPQESRKNWIVTAFEQAGIANSNTNGWQFWQQDNHPIELSGNMIIDQKLDYIHHNPVKAGFVDEPEDWRYSSAVNYCGRKGLLDVILIE